MRNLKKILALVLSLMMVLSVMVTASAADFSDADEIQYTEAVDVMNALGILAGVDGKFVPQGTLTRAQAAKIITFVALGEDTEKLVKGTGSDQFSDVTGGWAYDYISYCANEGIIDGDEGKFFPDAEVTGYQFGKMVLLAAGIEGTYTGSGWELNVAKALKDNDLKTGIENIVLSAKITREQASQMAFNALGYSVTGGTTSYVVTATDGTVKYKGTNETAAYLVANANVGSKLETVVDKQGSLGTVNYGLTESSSTDAFGRVSKTYPNGKDVTDPNYVEYASFAPSAVLTVKGAISEGKLATALGCTKVSDEVKITVIADGVKTTVDKTITKVDASTPVYVGAVGATVEVYKTGAAAYDVVVVNTYARKLEDTDVVAAVKATASTDAVPAYIKLDDSATAYNSAYAFVTDAFKAGNVVLYTKGKVGSTENVIQTVELAKAVTGKLQKYTTNTITVGGETYTNANTTAVNGVTIGFTNDHTFYVDADNNVYLYGDVDTVNVTADGFLYVLAYQVVYEDGSKDLFGDSTKTAAVKTQVITTEGEVKVIDLATYTDASGNIHFVNPKDGKDETIASSTTGAQPVNQWVAYTAEKDVYTVCALATGNAAIGTVETDYVKGTAKLDIQGATTDHYMTSATTYTYINTADKTTKATTGYKSIAIAASTKVLIVYADAAHSTVAKVYSVNTASDTSTSTANYAYVAEVGATVADGTEVTFYIGGEVKTMVVKTGVNPEKGHVYNLTIDSKGIVTAASNDTAVGSGAKVTAIEDTYVVTTTGATEFAANGYVCYNLTKDGASDTIEVGDFIVVLASGALVYIVG